MSMRMTYYGNLEMGCISKAGMLETMEAFGRRVGAGMIG